MTFNLSCLRINVTVFKKSEPGRYGYALVEVGWYFDLPLMKRNIYHPAIGCSCGLHTWPTLCSRCVKFDKNIDFGGYLSQNPSFFVKTPSI